MDCFVVVVVLVVAAVVANVVVGRGWSPSRKFPGHRGVRGAARPPGVTVSTNRCYLLQHAVQHRKQN